MNFANNGLNDSMNVERIKQPKISDVIEQKIERLIVEGTLSAGQKLPPERELAAQFEVSRPSIREAIQRLEAKRLVTRKQGGGTFVTRSLWDQFSDPLLELLSAHDETQMDLLEYRHAMEGVSAYFAALRGTPEDFEQISKCQQKVHQAMDEKNLEQEACHVIQLLIAICEASHNVVLLHILRSLSPLLEQNVLENLQRLNHREDIVEKVSHHRANIVQSILERQPEKALQASHAHLAYIEETLLLVTQEQTRRERSLRRIQPMT